MILKSQKGYTILEVLIFVAVSSLIFIYTMAAIGGKQQEVQFSQSTREFEAKIRDVINDVSTGYYPSNEKISCQVVAGVVQIINSDNQKLGTNNLCIYAGKAIQFKPDGKEDLIRIYALAGRRYQDDKLTPSSTIAAASPKAVARPGDLAFVGSVYEYNLLYGLKVIKVINPISDTVVKNYGTIAVMSSFGTTGVSDAQATQIGGISGSQLDQNETEAVNIINQLTDDVAKKLNNGYLEKNTKEGFIICLQSQDGNKASLTVGAGASGGTTLDLDNYNRACDL